MSGYPHFGKRKIRNSGINLSHREDIEPHEILWDQIARKREKKLDISERKIETPLSQKAVIFPFVAAVFLFFLFFCRVIQLQLMYGREFAAQANGNKYIFYKVQADRGIIFDRNFLPLVENLSTFDLVCDDSIMVKDERLKKQTIESLSTIVKTDSNELKKKIENSQEPAVKNLGHRTLIILEARINDFPGCEIAERPIRKYTGDESLSHVLGYMGKIEANEWKTQTDIYSIYDYIGRSGIEKSYEETLRKNSGQVRIERDAKGNIISKDIASLPESGKSVVLWIDLDLQKKIREVMQTQLKNLGLKKASVVALDPKTGGVLAMESFPSYDDNIFSEGKDQDIQNLLNDKNNALFSRPISGQYLTGSTIKPFIAAAALQEKVILPQKLINCEGKLAVQDQYNPEVVWYFNDAHIHGLTNMRKAIAESCNVYFYTIGGGFETQQGLGPTRIKKYLELFGWGSPTGIDLPSETAGFIPSPEWKKEKFKGTQDQAWTDGNTYWLSIGQEYIAVTPLQVAVGYAAIANGGKLYQPQVVQKIVDGKRNILEEKKPSLIRENFIDPANVQVVREGMRQAVTGKNSPGASAIILNSLPVPVAAKTGTAQLRKDPADGKDFLNSWVTVFAPYDDPQIVLMIMMEDVKEGQLAVLPVARDVLQWYFCPKDQLQSDQPAIQEQNQQDNQSQPDSQMTETIQDEGTNDDSAPENSAENPPAINEEPTD